MAAMSTDATGNRRTFPVIVHERAGYDFVKIRPEGIKNEQWLINTQYLAENWDQIIAEILTVWDTDDKIMGLQLHASRLVAEQNRLIMKTGKILDTDEGVDNVLSEFLLSKPDKRISYSTLYRVLREHGHSTKKLTLRMRQMGWTVSELGGFIKCTGNT
jgi:hypothetical protein